MIFLNQTDLKSFFVVVAKKEEKYKDGPYKTTNIGKKLINLLKFPLKSLFLMSFQEMKLCENLSLRVRYRTNIWISNSNNILTSIFLPRHNTFIRIDIILMNFSCYNWTNILIKLKCCLCIESKLFIIFTSQIDTLVNQWDVEGKIGICWDCLYVFIEIFITCTCWIIFWASCYFYFIPE